MNRQRYEQDGQEETNLVKYGKLLREYEIMLEDLKNAGYIANFHSGYVGKRHPKGINHKMAKIQYGPGEIVVHLDYEKVETLEHLTDLMAFEDFCDEKKFKQGCRGIAELREGLERNIGINKAMLRKLIGPTLGEK